MQEDPNVITYFATTNSRGKQVPFGIKRKDRERHMYIIGKTGMGKSTLLENLPSKIFATAKGWPLSTRTAQRPTRMLEYVPEHRIKDVVYFAPFDMEHPIAFNVMEDVGYDKRHLVVSGLFQPSARFG
jgi:ATPase subunit of ABC transporter with duplicated ATPase domains